MEPDILPLPGKDLMELPMKGYAALQLLLVIALTLAAPACHEQTIDDATLTAKVKAKMIADGRVSATRVNVDSVGGIVTLKGEVPTPQEKSAAEEIAKTVEGVKRVSNEITVNAAVAGSGAPTVDELKDKAKSAADQIAEGAKQGASEAGLKLAVKTRLVAAGFGSIGSEVHDGEVTLTGQVASEKERSAVETIVARENGVKKVINKLTIK
jgi:hyperosmotically inducible periplasmic protein